jgi:hypothetical protein
VKGCGNVAVVSIIGIQVVALKKGLNAQNVTGKVGHFIMMNLFVIFIKVRQTVILHPLSKRSKIVLNALIVVMIF